MNRFTFLITLISLTAHYYDYHIIGHLAVQISANFFPQGDLTSNMLYTYALIYISMLAKPLGALILGKMSDLKGRQTVIKMGMLITGLASIIISCIPNYSKIGIIAAVILLICRIIIATFASSGADAVRIYLYERENKRPCFSIGLSSLFSVFGTLIASLSVAIFTSTNFPAYSWRFSIALGGIFSLILYLIYFYYKDKIDNINYVKQSANYEKTKDLNIYEIIKQNYYKFILITISTGCIGALFNFSCIFWGNYNSGCAITSIKEFVPFAILSYIAGILLFSYLSDIILPIRIFKINVSMAIINYIFLSICIFNKNLHIAFYIVSAFFIGGTLMPALIIITKSTQMNIRNRLIGIAHAFGSIIISNSMPIIILNLYKASNICEVATLYAILLLFTLYYATIKLNTSNASSIK